MEPTKKRGRKPMRPEERSQTKSITLYPWEWAELANADIDGNATREAVRRIRKTLLGRIKNK